LLLLHILASGTSICGQRLFFGVTAMTRDRLITAVVYNVFI